MWLQRAIASAPHAGRDAAGGTQRDDDRRARTARLTRFERQPCLALVARRQLALHVDEPDAGAVAGGAAEADAVVEHRDFEHVCVGGARAPSRGRRAAGSIPCLIAFSTSVTSSIGGNAAASKRRVGLDREAEARAHAHLEQIEVGPDQFEFVAQIRLLAAQLRQRRAQIAHQAGDGVRAGLRLGAVEASDVAEHVEQEVRLDLRLQQRQLLLGLVAAQLRARLLRGVCGGSGPAGALVHVGDEREEDRRQAPAQRIGEQAQRRRQVLKVCP